MVNMLNLSMVFAMDWLNSEKKSKSDRQVRSNTCHPSIVETAVICHNVYFSPPPPSIHLSHHSKLEWQPLETLYLIATHCPLTDVVGEGGGDYYERATISTSEISRSSADVHLHRSAPNWCVQLHQRSISIIIPDDCFCYSTIIRVG